MWRGLNRCCPSAILLGCVAFLAIGCSRCKSGVTEAPQNVGPGPTTPEPGPQQPGPAAEGSNDHPAFAPRGSGQIGPRRLPTFVKLDYKGFPNPRGARFGSSKRQITVRPGTPGAISAALEKAGVGDTIILEGGTYQEPLDKDEHRAVVIEKEGIVIRSKPGKRARIVPRSATVNYGVLIAASHVMLQGLDIEGFSSVAVGMEKEGDVLKDIVLSDINAKMPQDGKWHDGIVVYTDNRSINKPASDGLLLMNVVVHGASLGVSCNAGPCRSWWLENVKVEKMSRSSGDADAIAVAEGDNIAIVNTEVSGATADGIDLKATRAVVWNCSVHNLARNGVKLWHGGDIVNTLIHHTGADAAIVFEHKGRYRILHSLVAYHNWPTPKSYNLTASHDAKEPLQVELINSIFYKTSGGMFFQDGTSVTIKNCVFSDMRNGLVLRALVRGKEVEVTLPQARKAGLQRAGFGGGNHVADPNFRAEAKGDFTLKRSSPAVNGGAMVKDYPATDFRGRKRVQGGKPDIGPFECF